MRNESCTSRRDVVFCQHNAYPVAEALVVCPCIPFFSCLNVEAGHVFFSFFLYFFGRLYSWEQWILRVVVNNTPRPISNDSAAVIERQRIQVGRFLKPLYFCWCACLVTKVGNLCSNLCVSLALCRYFWGWAKNNATCCFAGYCRGNVAHSAGQSIWNCWGVVGSYPTGHVRIWDYDGPSSRWSWKCLLASIHHATYFEPG